MKKIVGQLRNRINIKGPIHLQGCRIQVNIWKSIAFLYTNNEQVEFEIKKYNTIYIRILPNIMLKYV